MSITTEQGTIVRLEREGGEAMIFLEGKHDNRTRTDFAGQIIGGFFHPSTAKFPLFAMGPAVLRAIADLIEQEARR